MCRTGQLSSRTLILRRLDEDGFVIMTDKRSRKSKDLVNTEIKNYYLLFFVLMLYIIFRALTTSMSFLRSDVNSFQNKVINGCFETDYKLIIDGGSVILQWGETTPKVICFEELSFLDCDKYCTSIGIAPLWRMNNFLFTKCRVQHKNPNV